MASVEVEGGVVYKTKKPDFHMLVTKKFSSMCWCISIAHVPLFTYSMKKNIYITGVASLSSAINRPCRYMCISFSQLIRWKMRADRYHDPGCNV